MHACRHKHTGGNTLTHAEERGGGGKDARTHHKYNEVDGGGRLLFPIYNTQLLYDGCIMEDEILSNISDIILS